jgi:hypothetical protein
MTSTFHPDEFDVDDPGTGRRGAHRAKPNPLVAVVPLVLVTVAVVAIIVGAMTMLGGSGTTSGLPDTGADGPAQTATEGSSEPEPEATEPDATRAETATPTETATPSESAEPEPTVDPSVPVTVLNGTTTSGLAGAAAEQLTAAGFNVVGVDNFRQGDPPPTTVYYSPEESSASAAAIAEELGVSHSELDDSRGEGVVVVLGADYAP